ncbi:DHA2 family efflux MFS transporter permease subunit [Pullulanibacillus sp. KACC 23026]|uniref:DHA2 family efflux MFS transporter permease subunit n=1 Tax=Pullulanibacillus sp. KACC 23026 TaxID=3028315 RepID=UPI0023B0FF41|nr:DHA2 family efflux MFS transporter permease subunit [Pullulanibacillus sp. KACC 23026]WEG14926.1 DHA2 family efflux MFS transporter permease subunit [Pullulanibacillus sp. KACC 23026]
MLVGALIAFLNQTLINVALPQMMIRLSISATTADWLTTIFMLVNGIVIPITAFLMNRFTTRQLYLSAIGFFTIGTLICAIAPSFSIILIGRVIQAAGAGILFPLITNVIFTIFPPNRRGFAMGIFGVAMNFAPAVGPTLSGWVVEHHSWRVLFFIILPFAIIDFIVALFLVKNVTETKRPKLDVLGVILSTIGFGGVLYGFSEAGSRGWDDRYVIASLIIGAVSLLLFVWWQFIVSEPILEFRIFRYKMFSLTTIINVVVTMAMFSGMILMPIYMQNVRGFTPLYSGLMLLPGGIVMGIMSPITGRLFDKFGAKWLAVIGLAITAVTTYGLTLLELNTSFTYVITLYTIRMFGMSIVMMPIFTAGLNELALSLNKFGTAMVNTLRNVGGAVGMAFFVSIMTNKGNQHAKDLMIQHHVTPADKVQAALLGRQGMVVGIDDAFLVATGLTVIAFLLAFFIKRTEPKEDTISNRVRTPKKKVALQPRAVEK